MTCLPPCSPVVHVGDLDVHVRVSDRRRSIRLTVERDATVTAVIPPETDDANLAKVITAKRPWLYAKLRERAAIGEPRPPRQYVTGEGFPYLGRSYRLLIVDEAPRPVRLIKGRLELRRDSRDAARHLTRWYRQVGEPWLRRRITPWAQRMAVESHHAAGAPARLPVGIVHPRRQGQHPLGHHAAPARPRRLRPSPRASAPAPPRPRPRLLAPRRARHARLLGSPRPSPPPRPRPLASGNRVALSCQPWAMTIY